LQSIRADCPPWTTAPALALLRPVLVLLTLLLAALALTALALASLATLLRLLLAALVVLTLLALLTLLRILLLVRHRFSPFQLAMQKEPPAPRIVPGNSSPDLGLTQPEGWSLPMPTGAFWKGYLKLSLVTCPVAMQPAVSGSARLRFHTLNRKTGNRVQRQYVDAVTGERVEEDDQARGYPRGEGDHVILGEDELDAVALDSTRTIDVREFVPASRIGWIWYDRPHFLVPDDKVAEEAFSVIREAMRSTRTVGIARLVLYRRERAVMLKPHGNGILLWTLRYGDEVRDPDIHFPALRETASDTEALKLISRLIESRTGTWDPKLVEDPVQDRLLDLVESRRKDGKRPAKRKGDAPRQAGKVVNIIDALKRSIVAERTRR
jgi:DNA end-binding protein Ku